MKFILWFSLCLCAFAQTSNAAATYQYMRTVTVDHAQVPNTDLTDFPVYLQLTDTALKTTTNGGHVQSATGADITFFGDSNLTFVLPYEIVSYNGATGTLSAVVRCPLVSHTANTVFYLGYGAPGVTSSLQNSSTTWGNYLGVYHLEDNNQTMSVVNAAGAANAGNGTSINKTAAMTGAGRLGNGLTFNGTSDYIDLGAYTAINGATALTYSGWVRFTTLAQYASLLEKFDNPSGVGSVVSLSGRYQSTQSDWLAAVRDSSQSAQFTNGFGITTGTWYYFVATYDGMKMVLYINGSPVNLTAYGSTVSPVPAAASDLLVGKEPTYSPVFNGTMDELRISLRAYSRDWISAEYNNLGQPGSFSTLGAETTAVATVPTQSFSVQVTGTTPTQAILRYTAPDNNACTLAVSESAATNQYSGNFVTLVHDVDAGLFPGENLDSRASSSVNGLLRTVVIGARATGNAVDGNAYSRALQANTAHYYQIGCGNGRYLAQGSFTTGNLPLGNGAPDPFPVNPNGWNAWGWPTINFADKRPGYVDPQTGVLLKRWTSPGDEGSTETGFAFEQVADLNNSWTNASNIGQWNDGQLATFTGTSGPSKALFLWGRLSFYRASYTPVTYMTVDDVRLHLNGFGDQSTPDDRTMSVCLSPDYGQTCVGSTIDIMLPKSTSADAAGPSPWPAPLFSGWGDAHVTPDVLTNNFAGTIGSISQSTVTWGSNSVTGFLNYFPVTAPTSGARISIAGSDPICPNNLCTISSVTDEKTIVLLQNLSGWNPLFTTLSAPVNVGNTSFTVAAANGFVRNLFGSYKVTVESESVTCTTLTGTSFSNCTPLTLAHPRSASVGENQYFLPNFGFKVWKKTSVGTVKIDSAVSDWAASSTEFTDYQGAGSPYCSSSTVTANYAADGYTPIAPLPGYICLFSTNWGTQMMYFVAPSTGESRKLSNMYNIVPQLSPDSPTRFYAFNSQTRALQVCQYNAADTVNGRFKEWNDGRNQYINNPAISCTNLTASGNDVATEIKAAAPQIDQTYFGGPALQSVSYPLFEFMLRPSQGALAWFCIVDVSKAAGASQVVKCRNNWDTYPVRWHGSHGNEYFMGGGYTLMGAQTELNSPGTLAAERWDLKITQIYNNGGSTALTDSFVDPQTCEQLGVTDPRWIQGGATGSHCVRINIDNEPLAKTPAAGDLLALGTLPSGARPTAWVHNAASCGGDGTTTNCWSYLQPLQEGDYLQDLSQGEIDEKFLVAKKTVLANGTIDLVLGRNMNPYNCRMSAGRNTHSANWTAIVWPPLSCGLGTYFSKITDPPSATLPDNPNTYAGHTLQWLSSGLIEQHLTPYQWSNPSEMGGYGSGYGVRTGSFPGVLGQPFQFGVNDVYPFAGSNKGLSIGQVQSHPGGMTVAAPLRESAWAVDGRPLGGSGGGSQYLWNDTLTKVAGTKSVYQIGYPLQSANGPIITVSGWDASLDRKRRLMLPFAGYHLLQDISGPGSVIDDSKSWTFCIADFAGECVPGSQAGSQYVNVPGASTTGICGNDGTVSTPCLATAGPHVGAYTQFAIDRADPFGLRWRKLTNMFNGPGRTDNYGNMHALATGDWGVSTVKWADGRRSDVYGVKLPPWPNEDSIVRNTFSFVTVNLGGQTGTSVRIRFGYDKNLFCSTRAEQCTTGVSNSDPYAWASEPQTWRSCPTSTGCPVRIPAISSRVLYYVVDRKDGAGNITSSPMMMTVVK